MICQIVQKSMTGFNVKMPTYFYRNSHYEDKAVSRPSSFYNWNLYTLKDGVYIETGS